MRTCLVFAGVLAGLSASAGAYAKDCSPENTRRTNRILEVAHPSIPDCQKIPIFLAENRALRRLAQTPACYANGNFASAHRGLVARYDGSIQQQFYFAKKLHCNMH